MIARCPAYRGTILILCLCIWLYGVRGGRGLQKGSRMPVASLSSNRQLTIDSPGAIAKEGETIPFRHPLAKNEFIITHDSSVTTIYDNFQRSVRIFGKPFNI